MDQFEKVLFNAEFQNKILKSNSYGKILGGSEVFDVNGLHPQKVGPEMFVEKEPSEGRVLMDQIWLKNQLDALRDRHDMMRNDIFSEIGRLMHHVECYKLDANTYKGYAARIAAYQRFLQLDEDRS